MARPSPLKRFFRSLAGRFVFGVILIQLALVPMLFIGVINMVKNAYQSQFINHARSDAHLFSDLISNAFLKDANTVLQLIMDAQMSNRVSRAQVISIKGEIIAESRNFDTATYNEDFFFGQHGDSIYFVELPIYSDSGQHLANARLGYDESITETLIDLAFHRGVYLALGYFVLNLALIAFLAPQILSPLKRLRESSRRIAIGHSKEQLSVNSTITEVTELADDLNYMHQELVNQTEALEHQALHDPLTGLPNRALLCDRVNHEIIYSHRNNTSFGLLIMDLDRFKEVNDSLGHSVGDKILKDIAARLLTSIRESDTVARLGGDEFALVLPTADKDYTTSIAQKIIYTLQQPFDAIGLSLHIEASVGIAVFPHHGTDYESLLRRADIAMYAAKRAINRYHFYEEGLDQDSLDRLSLTEDLRKSTENGDFTMYYQPQVDLKTRLLCSAETLIRWKHPTQGLIYPDNFIPLAEKNGMINQITMWVVRHILLQHRNWIKQGIDISLAINLSAVNLQDVDFHNKLKNILIGLKMDTDFLIFELTESTIFSDPDLAAVILNRLNTMGIRLSIDDFGTGYSSLVHLKRLPISEIKIDKSFILDMLTSANDRAIVKATINLAHDLGKTVVAEGVEDEQTFEELAHMGCDIAQGHFISPPVTSSVFEQWQKLSKWGQLKPETRVTEKTISDET